METIKKAKRIYANEDWTTVILGGIIMLFVTAASLAGHTYLIPKFPSELSSLPDAANLAYMFAFLCALTIAGFAIMGKSVKNVIPSFAVIFALAAAAVYITLSLIHI